MGHTRAKAKRHRSHIRSGSGGHNMDEVLKRHGSLLVDSFRELTEDWGVRATWGLVAHHFSCKLASIGTRWDIPPKKQEVLVRNWLKCHRSRDKTFTVVLKGASASKKTREEVRCVACVSVCVFRFRIL